MGVVGKRSPLHGGLRRARKLAVGSDPWRGLRGQIEVELPDEELPVGVELGVAAEDQRAVVGGRKVNVQLTGSRPAIRLSPDYCCAQEIS
jgi:hypothetical protein